ncbi:hypothetical protein C0Z18_06590 [Trinickia dabaoshanensis]|uniref:DUF2345 domain-containing protein n=1 Tax=Trinickia dabaoshanensis TaxID=564714 RepID=A0A2N7VYC7_9BURK|nr:hypothetical protein C0Z18_06590 [Trinickia dabaoshanensis]
MNEPHLLLAGAGGLQATTPATVHINGEEHIALTAGRNVSVTARKSLLASVLGKISLFAQSLGIKLFAAKGAVEIQAQSDKMALAALKDLSISSTDGRVVITAAKEVWIGAGGSYIQINGNGIVNGSSGPIVEKTPKWSKQGADAQMPSFPPFGTGKPTDDYSHSL